MTNLLFTICGRAGSKGVASKNCRPFLEIPIAYYTLSTIDLFIEKYKNEFGRIDTCLSTDSQTLIDQVNAYRDDVMVVNRCEELSGDAVAKIDVIRDAATVAEQFYQVTYDYIVDLDITSPLRTVEDVWNCIQKSLQNTKIEIVFSVTDSRRSPYFNMVKKSGNYFTHVISSEFKTRQECPPIYDMNASIYSYNRNFLVATPNIILLKSKCDIVEMLDTGVLDIDSEMDLQLMQVIAAYLFEEMPQLGEVYHHIPTSYRLR